MIRVLSVTLLVVVGGPGLGQLLWARVSCPCLLMIRGAKVTCGSRALVTADKGNDPPQNGRGLTQAWGRGRPVHLLALHPCSERRQER